MTGIAIVASPQDAQFAESVRAGLTAAGYDASVSASLPGASAHVVLLWSAALDVTHAIDAQALIGLWSENRLTVVRRDETSLPLGLRDLESLPRDVTPAEVFASVREATQEAMATDAGPSHSKPDGHSGAFSRTPADATPGPAVQKETSSIPRFIAFIAFIAVAVIGLGSWYYFNQASLQKQAALTAALETATKAAEDLKQAQAVQQKSLQALDEAKAKEIAALKSGDAAKIKAAQEETARTQAEANKNAGAVEAREAAATKAREGMKKAQDVAKQAKAEPKKETVAVAPKPEPKVEPAPKAEPKAEVKAAPTTAASVPAVAPAPGAAPAKPAATEFETLFQQAQKMESDGNAKDAIRVYRRAARAGSGKAAKRLGEIFDKGAPGVSRDYAESLQWYETARQLGEPIPITGRRGGGEVTARAPEASKSESLPAKAPPTEPVQSKAPQRSPAEPKAAPPPPSPETDSTIGIGTILAFALLALAIGFYLWRRQRAAATPVVPRRVAPQAQPDAKMLFVSYSHKDKKRIEPIVSLMESMGRQVWMDRTAITGQTGWAGQIVRAIRECRAVVLMASPNSYASDQVVRELYLAMNHKKTIVPIEIEPAELPDELQYILAPFQHHRLSGGETRDVLGRALSAI